MRWCHPTILGPLPLEMGLKKKIEDLVYSLPSNICTVSCGGILHTCFVVNVIK